MAETKAKYQSVLSYFAAEPQMASQDFFSTLSKFIQVCVYVSYFWSFWLIFFLLGVYWDPWYCGEIAQSRREKSESFANRRGFIPSWIYFSSYCTLQASALERSASSVEGATGPMPSKRPTRRSSAIVTSTSFDLLKVKVICNCFTSGCLTSTSSLGVCSYCSSCYSSGGESSPSGRCKDR